MHKQRGRKLRLIILSVVSTALFAPSLEVPTQSSAASTAVFAGLYNGNASEDSVYVGGQSIGIRLNSRGVLVVGFERINNADSPAEAAHIQLGDLIEQVGATRIDSISDLKDWIKHHPHAEILPLVVKRGNEHVRLQTKLVSDDDGKRHLGLFVRDRTSGVGTLTFYDEHHHRYGALGHVITDADTGKPVDGRGSVYDSEVFGVIKGTSGKPGEKRGRFVQPDTSIGSIDTNSDFGVFGDMNKQPPHLPNNPLVPVAQPNQVHDGAAELLTVVQGQKVEKFNVQIENAVRQTRPTTKSMIVHVTDPRLLKETGGIVQGMSGSPILQDGRLVGAVTHVFVSDPTRGYGVYAAWMVKESETSRGKNTLGDATRHHLPAWLRVVSFH